MQFTILLIYSVKKKHRVLRRKVHLAHLLLVPIKSDKWQFCRFGLANKMKIWGIQVIITYAPEQLLELHRGGGGGSS
jgi:hypothetical protein